MRTSRGVLALSVLAMSGTAACDSPTEVALAEVNVSGRVTSVQDGSPIEGVSVTVGYGFAGLFSSGEGSLGPASQTGADGAYSLHYVMPKVVGGPERITCSEGALWLKVYRLDGWTMSEASKGSLNLRCTEAAQVVNVHFTPAP